MEFWICWLMLLLSHTVQMPSVLSRPTSLWQMSFLPELARISCSQLGSNTVRIWHPGCRQLLLSLPAFKFAHPPTPATNCDALHGDGSVDHRLVLDACHIISNHAAPEHDCYLSTDRAGQNPVLMRDNGGPPALAPGKYYYQPGPPSSRTVANYPIVTDFAAWKYPVQGPPDHWIRPRSFRERLELQSNNSSVNYDDFFAAVIVDDNAQCVVTKVSSGKSLVLRVRRCSLNSPKFNSKWLTTQYGDRAPVAATQVVRLVPRNRKDWFEHHNMSRYNWSSNCYDNVGTNDPANGLLLRRDLIFLLDEWHSLVFYPAGLGDRATDGRFMTYICRSCTSEYVPLLHPVPEAGDAPAARVRRLPLRAVRPHHPQPSAHGPASQLVPDPRGHQAVKALR